MGIKHSNQFANAPLLIVARQRQFMKAVMAELLQRCNSISTTIEAAGRKTTQRYCTTSWHKKAQCLFFYFHAQLGNFNQELTCLVFGFNTYTFTNWISQPVYYPKWVPFVTGFTFADVVNAIPQQHREKYVSVLLGSQVQLQP
jgi:hypothetical protein